MPDATQDTDLYSGDNQELIKKISQNTLNIRSKEWIKNLLNNIPAFIKGIDVSQFVGFSKGRPAVCCAAGPSLAKQLPLLRQLQDYVTIICVNTAYEPLIKAGIEPDFVIAIESKNVAPMFEGLPIKGILMRSAETGEDLSRIGFKHEVIWCNSTGVYADWMRYRMKEGVAIDGGGSVACAALSLAFTIQPSKIVLIGQDLAYTGGQAYSKGSRYQSDDTEEKKSVIFDTSAAMIFTARKLGINEEATAYDAGRMGCVMKWHPDTMKDAPVCPECKGEGDKSCPGCAGAQYACEYTSESFAFFLNWFLSAAGVIKGIAPDLPLINATEGGAYIAGFNHARLKSALRGVKKSAFKKNYKHKLDSLRTREYYLDSYTRELSDMLVSLKGHDLEWCLKNIPLFKIFTNKIHGKVRGDQVPTIEDVKDIEEMEAEREEFFNLVGETLRKLTQ